MSWKSSTSRVIRARDTGFYWSSENALHECFIASSGVGVWMKTLQLIAKRWKNASVWVYEFSLKKATARTVLRDLHSQWEESRCLCCPAVVDFKDITYYSPPTEALTGTVHCKIAKTTTPLITYSQFILLQVQRCSVFKWYLCHLGTESTLNYYY